MVAFFWNSFLPLLKWWLSSGTPAKLRCGRSTSSRRMTQVKMWKKHEFQKTLI
jgi:hypothetical protein